MPDSLWHTQAPEQVLEYFQSSLQGLSAEQIGMQRQKYGSNTLPEKKPASIWIVFLRQFQSPLIFILALAGVLIFFIKEYADAVIIFLLLVFNAIVGTIQEGKAQNTLASLKRLVETKATVLRSGVEQIVPDTEVVAGDVLVLHEGDKVAADARVISASGLTTDESSLTGESQPVYKTSEPSEVANLPTAEQKNMLFKGTNVVAGSGLAVVVATGINTVIGGISQKISTIESEDPIKRDVRKLSRIILATVVAVCAVLFTAGLAAQKPATEMLATVVSLSVSLIPEGLPVVLTLVLATGVWRMSKKNALVKKLQAVESLGQASVIAVDKTGTITKNELAVTKIYVGGKLFSVTGNGYEPQGKIVFNDAEADRNDPGLIEMGKISAFCANAHVAFSEDKKEWQVSGDPTEAALIVFAEKLGLTKVDLENASPKIGEIPFSYQTKYHAVLHKEGSRNLLTVVGAPEVILKLSSSMWHEQKNSRMTEDHRAEIEQAIVDMSQQGLRVLAAATQDATPALTSKNMHNLTFVGLIGMKDVLRSEVKEALSRAHDAGIKVVMITGDHRITAQAIAEEAGIFTAGSRVLTGAEIDQMTGTALSEELARVSVFARVTPEHKQKIIQAYQARGEIIAMTGDGVNDAPSLVAADLGVAMGRMGTEVAKEAADIILLDDNFGSIVSAVEEGRNIYKTIKKVILYLFSTGLGETLTIAGAVFLGFPLPILASQIIWLNFVTDGFLDVSLAMEPKEQGLLKEPRAKHTSFVDALMAQRMLFMAVTMSIGSLWLFSRHLGGDLVKAQTITLTVMAGYQWFNAWNCRSGKKSVFSMNPFSNKFLVGATITVILLQLLAVYNPLMQKFLKTTALSPRDWIPIIAVASSIILVEELRKAWSRRRERYVQQN